MSASIIKDGAALGKSIAKTATMYASASERIHTEFVSALWHVAAHGNAFYLNRIFAMLRPNDKSAVRLFIRRTHAIIGLEGENPDRKAHEIVMAAIEKGAVLKLKADEFTIVAGHNTKQAQLLVKLCEERFINPDGETDMRVLDRNNFTEVKTLGDEQVLKNLVRLATQVEAGDTDNRKLAVSPKVKQFLAELKDKAEVWLGQGSLAQETVKTARNRSNAAAKRDRTNKVPAAAQAAAAATA